MDHLTKNRLSGNQHLIYRDIKPKYFRTGIRKRGNQVNVVDFGLAKKYCGLKAHLYIPYRENKNLMGTVWHTPINTHLGVEQVCHDNPCLHADLPGLSSNSTRCCHPLLSLPPMTLGSSQPVRGLPVRLRLQLEHAESCHPKDRSSHCKVIEQRGAKAA
ncbi:serine/threonine protein kinase [Ceratobasidium sp. 370]|nr:serine/threonine protein kinase [Ceratobasidium sp. 370]